METRTQQLRNRFEQEKGKLQQIQKDLKGQQDELRDNRRSLTRHEQAREIVREVGLATQQQLQVHISDVTSLALESVFEDPYELVAEFVQRRNKTECDLYFTREGHRLDPLDSSGYGAVDVASLALRIAAWSMQVPKRRNVIILDEPFKFLDGQTDRIEKASRMIKELSDKLGIQFIIVTHNNVLSEYADKIFKVQLRNGKSKVT
jgi:DNA repair exonuclease SbcCD ATPase subunit